MASDKKYYDTSFDRVNNILNNPKYLSYVRDIEELEETREYCRHNMEHFLSVARIAQIINLQHSFKLGEDIIYATALLHDIGRAEEYRNGNDHAKVGALLAPELVRAAGFNVTEEYMIIEAIKQHRNSDMISNTEEPLSHVIYMADKLSRSCFYCDAFDRCNKNIKKRNLELLI